MLNRDTALADVFNREFQAHAPGEPWEPIMRNVAREIAAVVAPENPQAFLEAADWSGLFAGNYA